MDTAMFRSRDMTQASFEDHQQGTATKKRKRNRETLSCIECRQRKIACDRAIPCSNCVRFKRAESCAYTSTVAPHKGAIDGTSGSNSRTSHTSPAVGSHDDNLESIKERMAYAERMLQSLQGASKLPTPPAPSPSTQLDWRKSSNASVTTIDRPPGENLFCKGGRLSVKTRTQFPYYIGPIAWTITGPMDVFSEHQENFRTILMPQWKRFNAICLQYPPSPHDTILNFMPPTPSQDIFGNLQSSLPSSSDCKVLVRRFLDSVNEIYPIVVRHQFEQELAAFFADRYAVTPYWLSLLGAIISIGYMIPIQALAHDPWRMKPGDSRRLTSLAQQMCFTAAASSHRFPLLTFQTLLVLVLCKHVSFGWSDANNAPAGLLGLANRHVFSLGLHRDPSTSRIALSSEELDLRRKLFTTYLHLELDNCLRTGTPLMMRYRDFDTEEPSQKDNMHQVFLFRKFALLSSAIELTHSHKTSASVSYVTNLLRELASAAETLTSTFPIDQRSSSNLPDLFRSSLLAILINRIHEALLVPILEHPNPTTRAQYTNDLTAPANDVMELTMSLVKSVEALAQSEAVTGWKIFLLSQVQTSIFSVTAFQLVFLQRSLSDPSLLALRGNAPDSALQFRRIRGLFKLMFICAPLSRIGIKSHLGFISYLRTVEERFRIYIEDGRSEIDLTKDEGRPLLLAVAQTMEVELDELERAIQENALLDGLPRNDTLKVEEAPSVVDWQSADPSLLDGFDWPWTDMMFDQQFGLPVQGV